MSDKKVKIVGYAKKEFFDGNIEYRNFSDDLVGFQITSKGGTPLFTNSNFTITTNLDNKLTKSFNTGNFTDYLTLDDVKDESVIPNFTTTTKLTLNSDKSDLSMYALFGSLSEFIRVSLEEIIIDWPASLYVRENDLINPLSTGNTIENYIFDNVRNESSFIINKNRVENNFNINFDISNNLNNTFNSTNEIRDLVSSYSKYVIDFDNKSFEIIDFTGISETNEYLKFLVKGNPFQQNPNDFIERYHIRPNNIIVEEFFSGLSDFKSFVLNRLSLPKYSATFNFPVEGNDGVIVFQSEKLSWPVSDGYNIDFNTTEYITFATRLFEIAENYDNNSSDLINRELTSESISDFDTVRSSDGEIIESESQKMNSTLRIYGREYDEINKYIKGISFANVITYDKKNNTPDNTVKNIARVLGWELTSSILENDLISTFLVTKDSSYSGHSRGLTKYESEIELWRRLILNTPWIWKSKGTRKAIEFLLDFIGTPKGLINFNEYVYVSENNLDVNEVRLIMDELFGTREIDSLSIDGEGFPRVQRNGTIINGSETYFQKGGNWYRQTGGENSNIDILKGNNPHMGPYDAGKEFLSQFNNLIPNFSGVTLSGQTNYTQNKNIFINYNNGLISDLSVETVIASGDTNIDLENEFLISSPVGGCVFETHWDLNIYIDNILVGTREIFKTGPEQTITLPEDINFITGATNILVPLEISVSTHQSPISNGKFIFKHETDNCETSNFLNTNIRLETIYTVETICTTSATTDINTINILNETFNYLGSAETFNLLLDYENNELLNPLETPCYNLNSEIIEDPKPRIEDTKCGCEIEDCDQSLKLSVTSIPYDVIIYPCLDDNGIVGFNITPTGVVNFIDVNNNIINNISQECCEIFNFFFDIDDGLCWCNDPNQPPTVSGMTITLINNTYMFNVNSFINEFSDPDGDNPNIVRIENLPICGTLSFNGTPIISGYEFNHLDSGNLTWYIPDITIEPDGIYIYDFDLQTEINTLISSGFTQESYVNGIYTFKKIGDNLLPSSVDGTFESFPLVSPTMGFNHNVTGAGWINGQGTADTHLNPIGNVAFDCPPSPQGGIFAGAICKNQPLSTIESFYTNIAIEDGVQYVVSFYQCHAGDSIGGGAQLGDLANWEVLFDGELQETNSLDFDGFGNQVWQYQELTFTATRSVSDAKIEFVGGDGIIFGGNTRGCYIAIDDIKIREVTGGSSETVLLTGELFNDCCFTFRTSDDKVNNSLFSNEAQICIDGSQQGGME